MWEYSEKIHFCPGRFAHVAGVLHARNAAGAAAEAHCAARLSGGAGERVFCGARVFYARCENGLLVVSHGGEVVIRTDIDTRTLPAADREALEQGILLSDTEALAKLLEDYGS